MLCKAFVSVEYLTQLAPLGSLIAPYLGVQPKDKS